MENNPLEEIRAEIISSQSSNYIDDFTQLGISGEILEISNALDVYFGIDRSPNETREKELRTSGNELLDVLDRAYRSNTYTSITADLLHQYRICNFSEVNQLIRKVKTPLASIKEKLTKENKLYIDLSSMVVSIALKKVVSTINTYKKPESYRTLRYEPDGGFDANYYSLIKESVDVIHALKEFDMTKECRGNYEENRNSLITLFQTMNKTILQSYKESSTKTEGNGCLIVVVILFSSLFSIGGAIRCF